MRREFLFVVDYCSFELEAFIAAGG